MEKEILNILLRLEQFREDIENGNIQAGQADWVIRMYQAEVAQGHFDSRMNWSDILNG